MLWNLHICSAAMLGHDVIVIYSSVNLSYIIMLCMYSLTKICNFIVSVVLRS